MFDPTKGAAKLAEAVEDATNTFASTFEDLKPRQQLAVAKWLEDPMNIDNIVEGNLTNSSDTTTPAKAPIGALGGGAPKGDTPETRAAIDAALKDFGASQGQILACVKVTGKPGDANFIEVLPDGTPKAFKDFEAAIKQLEADIKVANLAKDAAEKELKDAKDKTISGSLAAQLEAAKTSAKGYDQTKAKKAYEEVVDAINGQKSSAVSSVIKGKDTVKTKLDALASEIGLPTT